MTLKDSVFKNEVALAISILLIATCLRAPFTSLGPLLETIQAFLHLSTAAAGLVNALPLLAFGTISPFAPWLARRLGPERTMGLALVLTGVGIVLRSFGTIWALFAGTMVLGCGIAVCNVLLPGLLKRDFPHSIPRLTALYALTMGISGALGSVLVVPLSQLPGWNWEWASGTLFILPFVAAISWLPQLANGNRRPEMETVQVKPSGKVSLWGSLLAWQVSLFFGLTSLTYYVCISWLAACPVDERRVYGSTGRQRPRPDAAVLRHCRTLSHSGSEVDERPAPCGGSGVGDCPGRDSRACPFSTMGAGMGHLHRTGYRGDAGSRPRVYRLA